MNILIQMKNKARSNDTIKNTSKALRHLEIHTNLNNPEQVEQFIANKQVSASYKKNLCIAYNKYCQYYKIKWQTPHYKPEPKQRRIPTKQKLKMIISSSGKTLATKLTISLECGLRPVELCNLKVKDIDLEQKIIYPTTAKHGNARVLKIKTETLTLLQKYLSKRNIALNDKVFEAWTSDTYGKWFRHYRNKLAKKLNDQSFKTIRLYDLRHLFATKLYHQTKDILFVKQQLGHRKLETTLIYTQLIHFHDDEYTSAVADTVEKATQLIDNGFEYVTEMDGLKLFRKRK